MQRVTRYGLSYKQKRFVFCRFLFFNLIGLFKAGHENDHCSNEAIVRQFDRDAFESYWQTGKTMPLNAPKKKGI